MKHIQKLIILALSPLLVMACSVVENEEDKFGYKPELRQVESALTETDAVSSRLLDWMEVTGKITEGGAGETSCESPSGDSTRYFHARHFWSVYHLSKGTLKEAMQNLRERFHSGNWEIIKDGPEETVAQSPELRVKHRKTGHLVFAVWHSNRSGGNPDLINFIVESPCYKAPDKDDSSEKPSS